MAGKYNVKYRDYSKQTSTVGYHTITLTAGNFAAQGTLIQALGTATNDLSLGEPAYSTLIADANLISADPAADINAQVERKWLVTYKDNVSNIPYQFEIPCADLEDNVVANSDIADVGSVDWLAFIAAFEAVARSPYGNAVTFLGAEHIGSKR